MSLPDTAAAVRSPPATPRRGWLGYRLLAIALVLSLAVHFGMSLWPAPVRPGTDEPPLAVSLVEMPPPPAPVVAPAVPKAHKARAHKTSPLVVPKQDAPPAMPDGDSAKAAPDPAATEAPPAPMPAAVDTLLAPPAAGKTLPPRVDLVYKLYLGAQGFQIGDATYRFEHADHRYRIYTVGKPRGLAALLVRGEGRLESRGSIGAEGLKPMEFSFERSDTGKREVARFDWDAGTASLQDNKTVPIEEPVFDPLSLMWQYYFTPPDGRVIAFSLVTTRRVAHYTVTREADETIAWGNGSIITERWHRVSDNGENNSYAWLAPSLRYLPVKMRLSNTRGTVDVVLDAIRVDPAFKAAADDWAPNIEGGTQGEANAPAPAGTAPPPMEFAPGATFPTNTGS